MVRIVDAEENKMTSIALNDGFGLNDLLADIRSTYQNWKLRRETRIALNRLSERELEDIGMNRADIDTAVGRI